MTNNDDDSSPDSWGDLESAAPRRDRRPYTDRIAIQPGDPRVAYRPKSLVFEEMSPEDTTGRDLLPDGAIVEAVFTELDDDETTKGQLTRWFLATNVPDPVQTIEQHVDAGLTSHLRYVYFANGACCGTCPPHPALASSIAANPWAANPWAANPWAANPWAANPWAANPWAANPWAANPEALNLLTTGKPPMSSAMPASASTMPKRTAETGKGVFVGVLDSGLAGKVHDDNERPEALRFTRIDGQVDIPDADKDNYLDPVAGHGTFIAGIVEQLTPGCRIRIRKVFEPEGDVGVDVLANDLRKLLKPLDGDELKRTIVNFSFGGTGTTPGGLFEQRIAEYQDKGVVFVAAAGNDGTCVEQYPAALPNVVSVGAFSPTGPAPWSNYGPWVDASAPGADLVSSFFANFDGAIPWINGMNADNFKNWATWSGTSFAAPVVVAALAREMGTTDCTAAEAVARVVRADHLARFPNMGTIVNY
jgi:hypothetical protein